MVMKKTFSMANRREAKNLELTRPPVSEEAAVTRARAENRRQWKEWEENCAALVPEVGDYYPPDFRCHGDTYGGRFLIKLADTSIYYVEVEDDGWSPVESGVLDEVTGAIIEPARGENSFRTVAIDVQTGERHERYANYEDGIIPGMAYALERALEDGETVRQPGHFMRFLLDELSDITGIE